MQLETGLRRVFAEVNECPKRLLTAEVRVPGGRLLACLVVGAAGCCCVDGFLSLIKVFTILFLFIVK